MIKYLNTVTRMSRLSKELQERIRNKEEGLFKNTLIRDDDLTYGYDRDGIAYQIDTDDIICVGRLIWHHDRTGYLVTDNVCDGQGYNLRMEELVLGLWNPWDFCGCEEDQDE